VRSVPPPMFTFRPIGSTLASRRRIRLQDTWRQESGRPSSDRGLPLSREGAAAPSHSRAGVKATREPLPQTTVPIPRTRKEAGSSSLTGVPIPFFEVTHYPEVGYLSRRIGRATASCSPSGSADGRPACEMGGKPVSARRRLARVVTLWNLASATGHARHRPRKLRGIASALVLLRRVEVTRWFADAADAAA
jgi:hypothetical protein